MLEVTAGPRGNSRPTLQLKVMNAIQGWHDCYLTRDMAAQLIPTLAAFAERGEQPNKPVPIVREPAVFDIEPLRMNAANG